MQVFNPNQISLAQLLKEAQANRGKIKHIYLHWTAGRYDQFFDDYHLNIDGDGKVYRTCASLDEKKAHTYQRNSGSIGITLCCALDASWQGGRLTEATLVSDRGRTIILQYNGRALSLPLRAGEVCLIEEGSFCQ